MGTRIRCPGCNRYGNKELNYYCRACDANIFEQKALKSSRGSAVVLNGVLKEFGALHLKNIRLEDRSRFINMIKRRRPNRSAGGIVRKETSFLDYGYEFAGDAKKIKIEKDIQEIEH